MSDTNQPQGFAPAVAPLAATTIITDEQGLDTRTATFPSRGGAVAAYVARPQEPGKRPIVLVVHEIFGLHEHIRDVARRLAKQGYVAIAPELFGAGDPSVPPATIDEARARAAQTRDEDVLGDLDAAVGWAAEHAGGDPARVAITGFCWGGRITWLYAAHRRAKAAVAWYGRLVGETSARQPRHPIDVARELQTPVLGLYGGVDQGIPLDTVEAVRTALAAAPVDARIDVFPEAPHAFHADYRPSFRPAAAALGWSRLLGWFRDHGV